MPAGLTEFAHLVLDVVDAIPPGRVLSYGAVADIVERGSARGVGSVLARHGSEVPWHRIVMADGSMAAHQAADQRARLRADGTPLLADGRVDMSRAAWVFST